MNFLGKLFIILNFVLSILFLAVSGTLFTQRVDDKESLQKFEKQRNTFIEEMNKKVYKNVAAVDDLSRNAELESYFQVIDKLSTDWDSTKKSHESAILKLKSEKEILKTQLSAAENDMAEEKSKRLDAEQAMRNAEAERKKLLSSIENLTTRNEDLIAQLDIAKDEVQTAKREHEALYLKYLDVITKVARFETETRALEKETEILQGKIDELAEFKEFVRKRYPQLVRDWDTGNRQLATQDVIRGKVLAVHEEFNFVIIDRGGPDGVKPGTQFIVYRNAQYVGRIEVDKVIGEYSSAKITTQRLPFQQGDSIANQLK